MDGPATGNASSVNLVQCRSTVSYNSQEKRIIPSLRVTDVNGTSGQVILYVVLLCQDSAYVCGKARS